MDFRWLDDILVLLEEGNLTRAAARRNITQPAFSRRIRSFEAWLGTRVLDRRTNRVDINASLRAHETEIRALTARVRELRSKLATYDPASVTITITAQHAPIHSKFPDLALEAQMHYPSLKFRLRPGNQRDCVSLFLKGDADIFLSYEAEDAQPLPFGDTVRRCVCGMDRLVPVAGGSLRQRLSGDGPFTDDLPAITYPEDSYFGQILSRQAKLFGTRRHAGNPICETALSSGIKEMVLKGMGIGWLPLSMCYRELESGDLVSLVPRLGTVELRTVLYGDTQHEMAMALVTLWQNSASGFVRVLSRHDHRASGPPGESVPVASL